MQQVSRDYLPASEVGIINKFPWRPGVIYARGAGER